MTNDDIRKEIAFLVFGVVAIVLAIFMSIFVQAEVNNAIERMRQPEFETIYDSSSEELVEFEGSCPECGNESIGINGNIVCRNENCPNYGLAVPVDSRD